MAELIKKMNEGKNEYSYPTPDGRVVYVKGDTEKEAHDKFNEYMGWD